MLKIKEKKYLINLVNSLNQSVISVLGRIMGISRHYQLDKSTRVIKIRLQIYVKVPVLKRKRVQALF